MTAGLTERNDYLRRFGAQAAERGCVASSPYLVNDQASGTGCTARPFQSERSSRSWDSGRLCG
jgi:hypothetical protein